MKEGKVQQDQSGFKNVIGKGYKLMFGRQFIHYNSSNQVASLKLDWSERKHLGLSCQNEGQADGCDRTCKAKLKDEKGQRIRNAEFPPLTCDIINNNCNSGVTNVARNQAPEPLLTCCVP